VRVEQIREESRDAGGTAFIDNTVRDILYALRTFKRAPLVAFTIVSTATARARPGRHGIHGA
jgi:hypothetical protein